MFSGQLTGESFVLDYGICGKVGTGSGELASKFSRRCLKNRFRRMPTNFAMYPILSRCRHCPNPGKGNVKPSRLIIIHPKWFMESVFNLPPAIVESVAMYSPEVIITLLIPIILLFPVISLFLGVCCAIYPTYHYAQDHMALCKCVLIAAGFTASAG